MADRGHGEEPQHVGDAHADQQRHHVLHGHGRGLGPARAAVPHQLGGEQQRGHAEESEHEGVPGVGGVGGGQGLG